MTTTMTYAELYNKMVNKFTVEKDSSDYKLGDYMLAKARKKKETAVATVTSGESSSLPMPISKNDGAVVAIFSYVKEKLKVKEAPIKDKTIRKFPVRSSVTAFLSAVVCCSLIVLCGFFGFKTATGSDFENTVSIIEADNSAEEVGTETIGLPYTDSI